MALIDVVKYDGTPDVFAFKHPKEDLSTLTQLVVNNSQVAVLFKEGKALDEFKAGRHTLETLNIPILNNFINLPFGGRSPFTAEVWFVNLVSSLGIKWGTASPIQLQDPKYHVFIPVRAYGQFGIRIKDARKFLTKLVGTLHVFNKENMTDYFRGLYLTKVKDSISTYLIKSKISVMEINAYLEEISEEMQEKMKPTLEEYGIEVTSFYVNSISVPEDDPAVQKLKNALAKRAEMNIIGYDYAQERSFDTLEGAATNSSSMQGGMMGAGMGIGMGMGLGGNFGHQMGQMSSRMQTHSTKQCPKCNHAMNQNARFCASCGHDTAKPAKENKPESSANRIKCSQCGTDYANTVRFCPHCGDEYKPCPQCKIDLPDGATRCPECNTELPKPCRSCGHMISPGAKFCRECGKPQTIVCSKCNAEIAGSPKFCGRCGNQLM